MNRLAEDLNAVLDGTVAGRLLSDFGRRMFFPKGIIAQAAEARGAARANATIGMAFEGGAPMMLSALGECMSGFAPEEIVSYAPTAGFEWARALWKEALLAKNPSLRGECMSLPAVVPGITAGLSYAADLFLDAGQPIVANDPAWDNYGFIFEERRGARVRGVPFFAGAGLDVAGLARAVREEAESGAVRIILNFPNNPAGYSPDAREAEAIVGCLVEAAEGGACVLAICDDAYFGLLYEEECCRESLFAALSGAHERILAVKTDGPTKEDCMWGLRAAFLTFGSAGLSGEGFEALVQKLMGTIRSSVSCSNTLAQVLLKRAAADPRSAAEKARYFGILRDRYRAVKRFVAGRGNCPVLRALPFNSGYFMCFVCQGVDAEALRRELLARHGIGVVALGGRYVRFAFSSVEEDEIAGVLETMFQTAEALAGVGALRVGNNAV